MDGLFLSFASLPLSSAEPSGWTLVHSSDVPLLCTPVASTLTPWQAFGSSLAHLSVGIVFSEVREASKRACASPLLLPSDGTLGRATTETMDFSRRATDNRVATDFLGAECAPPSPHLASRADLLVFTHSSLHLSFRPFGRQNFCVGDFPSSLNRFFKSSWGSCRLTT